MHTWAWIVLIIVAVVVGAGLAWTYLRRERTKALAGHFGPEYDRTVTQYGDRGRAEAVLEAREERVSQLDIHPVSRDDRARFGAAWLSVQQRFVDDPSGAVGEADGLVQQLMRARGYPVGDFDERAADISVSYPDLVENYRAAHRIAERNSHGEASTEDLRQAMIHYRSLFDELLGAGERVAEREARR